MTGRRPLKVYYRDENKVFRAIEGVRYSQRLLFIDKSVYTKAGFMAYLDSDIDYVFEVIDQ